MRNLEGLWEKWPKWGVESCSWQKNDVIPTGSRRVDLQKLFKISFLNYFKVPQVLYLNC